jgi:hypothetical protein
MMKFSMLGVLSFAVLILSFGLVVPEANAKPSKEWMTQYKTAVKELKLQNSNEYKAQKTAWKQQFVAGEISKKEFKTYLKGLQKQHLLELKALKAEWKQAWKAGGGYPGSHNNGGNGINGGNNSVPIADTFLPFAGAFAGLVYWRARQLRV